MEQIKYALRRKRNGLFHRSPIGSFLKKYSDLEKRRDLILSGEFEFLDQYYSNISLREAFRELVVKAREDLSDVNPRTSLVQVDSTELRYAKIILFTMHEIPFFANGTWYLKNQMNVLLGKNGYGKTHLLRAVLLMIANNDDRAKDFFTGIASSAELKMKLQLEGNQLSISRGRIEYNQRSQRIPTLAIPSARFINQAKTTVSYPEPEGEFEINNLYTHGEYRFLNQLPYEAIIQTFLYELCIKYLENGQSFRIPIFHILQQVILELTGVQFTFARINTLRNARFEILVYTDGNTDYPLPIQKASQGTLSILSIFGLIYDFLQNLYPNLPEDDLVNQSAIVFIDEIDAHLHPTWQQKILGLLRKYFPGVQFIVTAHSPLIVSGCYEEEVSVLRKNRKSGKFKLEQFSDHFIGRDIKEIFQMVFDMENVDDDDTYLHYLTRSSVISNESLSTKIDQLASKQELTDKERTRLDELYRIDQIIDIKNERRENDKDEEIERLQAEIRLLKQQLDKD